MRDAWANRRNSPLIASPAEDQKILNSRRCTQEGVRAGVKAASIACVGSAVPTQESAGLVILEEEDDATSVSVGSEALDQLRVGTRRVVADLGAKGWTIGAIESLLEVIGNNGIHILIFSSQITVRERLNSNRLFAVMIPFQLGLSKLDLRKVMKSSLSGVDKSITAMYKKLQKNLTSEELLPSLWDKCKNLLLDAKRKLGEILSAFEFLDSNSMDPREA